eukprot:CAMPEP_0119047572 /NCGR_PEP_ID=MMETSP1177-20130426/53869_1 /TAXON_ID=2985 /ORGANISM="Ochromonas sp, Strain CCMP1899" /LENGTH=146 /DNA_ID=CAMNT_0007022337 /DNA_START=90 /DNA_END=527 /DNA_ORIENTATION=+
MSVANTSFQSDAFGDISGFSDNNFGSYSGGFSDGPSVQKGRMPSARKGRQQTPFARKGRFGYVDDEDEEEDERSLGASVGTPYRETDSGYGGVPSSAAVSRGGQGSRMMLGARGTGSEGTGPSRGVNFDMGGQDTFDQLEASWLTW